MKKVIFVFLLSLFLLSTNAFSQAVESPLQAKFLVEGGIEYGGDEILKVFFTNGGDQTIRAGQGGFVAVGGQLEFSKIKNLMLRTSIGIKYNTTAADNANIRLTRIPINVMPSLKIKEDFRLGLGITSHQNVKFKGDGFVSDLDFKSLIGPRVELGYKWIAVTYTALNYQAETGEDVSANSLGLAVSLVFPK
ncbi:hypothetical protein GCM10027346_42950 [Hymenobacter seoulensis]